MTNTSKMAQVNRTHKARIFEMIFRDKDNLLELYNAVNGTAYTDSGALTITTLENASGTFVCKNNGHRNSCKRSNRRMYCRRNSF